MRPYRIGASSGKRVSACSSRRSTGSRRIGPGSQVACAERGSSARAALPRADRSTAVKCGTTLDRDELSPIDARSSSTCLPGPASRTFSFTFVIALLLSRAPAELRSSPRTSTGRGKPGSGCRRRRRPSSGEPQHQAARRRTRSGSISAPTRMRAPTAPTAPEGVIPVPLWIVLFLNEGTSSCSCFSLPTAPSAQSCRPR